MSLPSHEHAREGWLPIETDGFDRVFISIVLFVAINLRSGGTVHPRRRAPVGS
jgi:hypothetical protein